MLEQQRACCEAQGLGSLGGETEKGKGGKRSGRVREVGNYGDGKK